jgi:hypothetical protein
VSGMRQSYFAGSRTEQVKFLRQTECKWDIPASEGDLMLITASPVPLGAAEQPAKYSYIGMLCLVLFGKSASWTRSPKR